MSWVQLESIIKQNKQIVTQQSNAQPVACPIDGAMLQINSKNVRNCPLGNFTTV
tara:strand:- start:789 stop:950 length:162 start_codon:yes stop_codon:yes gene_type:complete